MFGILFQWRRGARRDPHPIEPRRAVDELEREVRLREAAEAALHESRQRLRLVVDSALDAVVGMDAGGRITEWNAQAETIFGWERAEALGKPLSSLIIPPRLREAHERGLRRFLATGEGPILDRRIEVEAIDRAGREFPVELTVTHVRHDAQPLFHAFLRDITERRRAEVQLARQALEARLLHEATMLAAQTDSDEEALRGCVAAVCAITGWPGGHVLLPAGDGTPDLVSSGIWHLADPESFRGFRDATAAARFAPGDGLPGRILVTGEPLWVVDAERDPQFARVREHGDLGVKGAFGFPIRVRGEVVAVLEFFSPAAVEPDPHLLVLTRSLGEQVGRVLERRRFDLELARRADELRRKNAELEQFVYTVSHDLKSPVVTMLGFLDVLREDLEEGRAHEVADSANRIERAARRMHALINELLELSRLGVLPNQVKWVDVGALVRELVDELAMRIDVAGADVQVADDMPLACADRARLKQVLENLLTNALKYGCPRSGCGIAIGGRRVGEEVRYFVRDSGPGIPPAYHDRVFGIFQRLDTRGEGTGVGLAIVARVMESHGGRAWVESAPGEGATFWIALPARRDDVVTTPAG